jgi:hypothetical protein
LAISVGISPSTLSAWQNRIYNPPLDDPRALKLAAKLGVPATETFTATAREAETDADAAGAER